MLQLEINLRAVLCRRIVHSAWKARDGAYKELKQLIASGKGGAFFHSKLNCGHTRDCVEQMA